MQAVLSPKNAPAAIANPASVTPVSTAQLPNVGIQPAPEAAPPGDVTGTGDGNIGTGATPQPGEEQFSGSTSANVPPQMQMPQG